MFTKILIANRGEIAVRIMATCREMGIRTVAVYSDADRDALHVREADEAHLIGPAPAAQSYLRIETIVDVAKRSGAEAIHPGYGFLSENTAFVEACEQAGIVFIGPPASAMRLMGSKIAAKHLAQSVNAPVIPGYNGDSQDDAVLLKEAERIGFPLLVKASAGGGGKGMREVHSPAEFLEQLAGARREAQASFGDDTVFLERLLLQPRHIEIQILGDTFGNIIHLGERECSIQRRHQKILEESPSVALTPALRAAMGATAVRIAQAAGYVNAGTVEFMLDTDKLFYFLEMNTRLQVEHPITECVTGIDLVRHQLLIASGTPLHLTQEQLSPRGHAIEMRLYAEDPNLNFLPSTGTVTRFNKPAGPGIRIDSGIESGDEITQYYDPMIAKMIVYGEDRAAAIARMHHVLERSAVFGVKTNTPLLYSIITHPAFQEGLTYTDFLVEHNMTGDNISQRQLPLPIEILIAAALYDTVRGEISNIDSNGYIHHELPSPWKTLGPWRMIGEARRVTYIYDDKEHHVAICPVQDATDEWSVQVDARPPETIACVFGKNDLVLLRRGAASQLQTYVQRSAEGTAVILQGQVYNLERRQPPTVETAAHGSNAALSQKVLKAPMSGTIVKVQARDGDNVEQRQVLVILSAMKMEHTIAAPYTGKIRHVYFQEGAVVNGGATIVEME
ncbi:MAG: acetyl-CoA carboxylase biotin carboxylase subunit [Ktedonobacteraceae bacterium]